MNRNILTTQEKDKGSNMQIMTQEHALAVGYIHCVKENADYDHLIKITDIKDNVLYRIVYNEPIPYRISENLIEELLDSYLSDQEDVADEDGELCNIAASVDYTEITHTLNEAFKNKKYYFPTKFLLKKYYNSDEK